MKRSTFTILLVLALVATSCGEGDGTAAPSASPTTTAAATTTSQAETTTTTIAAATTIATTTTVTTTTVATLARPDGPWPSARLHPTFVHDPASGKMLMFSGLSQMGSAIDLREIWALDTAELTWELIGDTKPLYTTHGFAYDPTVARVLGYNLKPYGGVLLWDAATGAWDRLPLESAPPSTSGEPRFGAPLTYDAESARLIMFAGGSPWFMYEGTWAYDASSDTWEEMSPALSPSPRGMYPTAYDAESDRVLLWGGFTGDEENDVQIWAYDYNTDSWEALPNETGPQQHWERHGMAYIPGIDRVLFFTGMLENAPVFDPETWYYDYNSNTWERVDVASSPPGLAMYSMAYDPNTEKVYLFGGDMTSKYAGDLSNDLWIFDPATEDWTKVPGPTE